MVVWRIVPTATPRVARRCPRCGVERRFASSDKFRINAQKRRLDVWLVYKCEACDATWNCEVRARVAPEELPRALYEAWLANDRDAAWACAFDAGLLARAGARADFAVPYRVEREGAADGGAAIRFALAAPCEVRLGRLLAAELGLSRTALGRRFPEAPLRKPVRDGQVVELSSGGIAPPPQAD